MTDSASPSSSAPAKPFGGRWTYAVLIVALLFVMMPFLFWNATWFGRPMTDQQLGKALGDHSHPREVQHALTQIESRIERNDPSVRQWYHALVSLSSDSVSEIRLTDAWVMGQDAKAVEFHEPLLRLLTDSQPMVRRNAALSLVRFGDDSGHDTIVEMLRPFAMPAPATGTVKRRLKLGDSVNPGTLVGHIQPDRGAEIEVRATVPGTLTAWAAGLNSRVAAGQTILYLAPSQEMAWEALRALYLVGRAADIPAIEPYARGVDGMPPQVQQQAALAIERIRTKT